MLSRWEWLLLHLSRRLWLRAGLISLLAVAAVLAAIPLQNAIPEGVSALIGADSVDDLLRILASSMLAVTTFSLTTMVSAYSAATNSVTPRATKLLMEDTTTQNVLATFIGSFLFSLFGIAVLSTDLYNSSGRAVLFVVTLALILLIVVALLRWIEHLSLLGRVGHTTDRVEHAARDALHERICTPCLGAQPLRDAERDIPQEAFPIHAERIGYVQHIDIGALQECAETYDDGAFYVLSAPGSFVDPSRPLARVVGVPEDVARECVCRIFALEDDRSFDQDPRFGLSVLAEIASRALSPAVNDPGTAIDVVGRAVRVLAEWRPQEIDDADVPCPRVWMAPVTLAELFDDVFMPIARDGAAMVEVQIRLQKAFLALSRLSDDPAMGEQARQHSHMALARAEAALVFEGDIERVREVAGLVAETASQ